MANLSRRNQGYEFVQSGAEWDPVRVMRDILRWDPFREVEAVSTGTRLSIAGRREQERHDQGDTFYASERSYGSFTRSFTLPEGVDGENVAADLKSGVLTLTVPKKPELQPKKIAIGAGAKAPGAEPGKA
jgi:hypothetical protein